jgi:iron complex outermembrane recepter protein
MKYKTWLMSSAVCALAAVPVTVVAQEQQEAAAPDRATDVIIVSGIRDSLKQAAQVKRDADQIIDVITADDVGKLPDDNVAEALQRVTGVQISRVFGEGQSVNIRGLQQVRVEVDGRTLLGFSGRVSPPENDNLGRSSGLDAVPSSLFGRLEVAKSSIASQVEGGLGGTVNLKTPKPFDFKKPTLSLRARGTYSDQAEVFEPAFQALATTTFGSADQFGILLSGEYQKRTSKLQLFERNQFLTRRNGDATATNRLGPLQLQYENVVIDRSRLGLSGAFQWRASDYLTMTLDGLYSRVENDRTNQALTFILPTNQNLNFRNAVLETVGPNEFIVAADATGRVRVQNQRRTDPTDNLLAGFNAKYDNMRGITVEADAYFSRGTLRQEIEVVVLDTPNNIIGSFDFRDSPVPSLTLARPAGTPFSLVDPGVYNFPATGNLTLRANQLPANLQEYAARLDFGFEVTDNFKITTGIRYVDLDADSTSFRSRGLATRAELEPFQMAGDPGFLSGVGGNFPREFVTFFPDREFLLTRVLASEPGDGPDGFARNAARDYVLNEKTFTGYIMGNVDFALFGLPAKFNGGVRVTHTDFVSITNTLVSSPVTGDVLRPTRDTNSFTNILPSANFVVNVTDDFLVRLAASTTMQRAGLADLAPSTFVNQTNLTSGGGNALLTPPISTNFDVSFEYYLGGSNLISGAVFYKDVKDAITTGTIQETVIFEGNPLTVQTSRPFNIDTAKVKGFEIGITQFFDFLPAPLDGLGIIANYTFADSEDSSGFPLVATSKHSYNLVGLYEKGPFSARVAYNWRDDSIFTFTDGRPNFVAALSQLDAQMAFKVTKDFTIQMLGQNLTPQDSAVREFSAGNPTALNRFALAERRLSIGAQLRFR